MCFKRTGNGWLELVRTVPQASAQRTPAASSTTPKPVIKEPGSIPKTRMLSSGALTVTHLHAGECTQNASGILYPTKASDQGAGINTQDAHAVLWGPHPHPPGEGSETRHHQTLMMPERP